MSIISSRRSLTGISFAFAAIVAISTVSASAATPATSGAAPTAPTTTVPACRIPVDPTPIGLSAPAGSPSGLTVIHECRIPVDPIPVHPCQIPVDAPVVGGAGSAPAQPITTCPIPVDPGPFPGNNAYWLQPTPGLIDVHPVAFDHVGVSADGLTLTVYWWGGSLDCYGLDSVKVTHAADGSLVITLFVGTRSGLEDIACNEMAIFLATDVTLDHPLFTDGSAN